jgi:hypothetical protein
MNEVGASIGEDESVVLVPRDCILATAKQLVPEGAPGRSDGGCPYVFRQGGRGGVGWVWQWGCRE